MYDPKPTVGRIVIYHLIDTGAAVPAVVVTVDPLDPDRLGLHVMHPQYQTPEGVTIRAGCFHTAIAKKGDAAGQWGWPARVQ